MEYGKYIIVEEMGHEVAIMFSSLISHDSFLHVYPNRDCIKSAGFFAVGAEPSEYDSKDISVGVWGKSTTLKLDSRKDKDERLIKKVLRSE